MLYQYAGSPDTSNRELSFSDMEEISSYAREAVRWSVENGILSGYGNDTLAPGRKATRAEAAAMMMRFIHALNEMQVQPGSEI